MFLLKPHSARRSLGIRSQNLRLVMSFAVVMFASLFLGSPEVASQVSGLNAIAGADPGVPDTISVTSADVNQGDHFSVQINMVNDEELSGGTVGIGWGTPDLFLDSISFVGSRLGFLSEAQRPTSIDNGGLFAGLAGFFVFFPPGVQPGSGLFATLWFTVNPAAPDQFIDLDSLFFPPSGDFLLVALAGNASFVPQFEGGKIKIGNPSEPSTISATPTDFTFEAVAGGINPPIQALNIKNIGLGTLNWNATFSSTWLDVSPANGVAPSVTQVLANSIGLPIGTYFDTIRITDPNATNSPFEIPVSLSVTPPPPTISVSQNEFFFNAVADSTSPPAQLLIVKNVTTGSLSWTSSHTESWLAVSPVSGGDSTDVILAVDITGLPFGEYKDTLFIADPNATNSPVRVAVNLSVASDLPIISLDPDTLHQVVDLNQTQAPAGAALLIDSAYIVINNAGAGTMTYSLSEFSSRILSLEPLTGTAPESVLVVFRLFDAPPGDDFDTIMVSSPEAINSPQPLIVRYHYTFTPANIVPSPDTLEFSLFECEQGASFVPQIVTGSFTNFGEPAPFTLEHDIDWLTSMQDFGVAPMSIGFIASETGLPAGEYVDSIKIIAPISQTNPQYMYVRLTVRPAVFPALIFPNKELFIIPAREGTSFQYGPTAVLQVTNFQGGCFNWSIQESISWLSGEPLNGINPQNVLLLGDGTNLLFGEYDSLFTISSAEASNSPKTISVKLRVWRLFGDANYSNRINISDVVYLIDYIFNSGPQPEPAIYVADVNCTGTVNISDVTFLIDYIFVKGDAPCGNEGL